MSIRAQLDLIETDPATALRQMLAQAVELQIAATGPSETELGGAIGSLQKYLIGAIERGGLRREIVEEHLTLIRTSRERAVSAPTLDALAI